MAIFVFFFWIYYDVIHYVDNYYITITIGVKSNYFATWFSWIVADAGLTDFMVPIEYDGWSSDYVFFDREI